MRGEETDRVVAPVVRQALLLQVGVVDELMDRHELDGRRAQVLEVVDDGGLSQTGVGAPQFLGNHRVQLGHALDVGLVDDRLVVLVVRGTVVTPVEVGVDDHRAHGVARRVLLVAHLRVVEGVGVQSLGRSHLAGDRLGVRVQQQLGGVAAVTGGRVVGARHPVAVLLTRRDSGQVGVPDVAVDLLERHPLLVALVVEQAQVDTGGGRGVEGEVRSRAVIGRPERVGVARPDLALGALLRFRCGLRRRCCRRGHGDYPATTEVRRQESGRKTCHVGASPGKSPGAAR